MGIVDRAGVSRWAILLFVWCARLSSTILYFRESNSGRAAARRMSFQTKDLYLGDRTYMTERAQRRCCQHGSSTMPTPTLYLDATLWHSTSVPPSQRWSVPKM